MSLIINTVLIFNWINDNYGVNGFHAGFLLINRAKSISIPLLAPVHLLLWNTNLMDHQHGIFSSGQKQIGKIYTFNFHNNTITGTYKLECN